MPGSADANKHLFDQWMTSYQTGLLVHSLLLDDPLLIWISKGSLCSAVVGRWYPPPFRFALRVSFGFAETGK
jgi:hypothetical protein